MSNTNRFGLAARVRRRRACTPPVCSPSWRPRSWPRARRPSPCSSPSRCRTAAAASPRPRATGRGCGRLADRYGFLLVADEVITAFGRLGEWFGGDRYGARPDIVTVAKGITAGYAPMGATLVEHQGRRGHQPARRGPQPRLHLRRAPAERGHRPAQPGDHGAGPDPGERPRPPGPPGEAHGRPRGPADRRRRPRRRVLLRLRTRRRPRRRRLQRHRPRRPDRRPDPAPAARGRPAGPRLQPLRAAGPDRAPADQRPRTPRPYRRHHRGHPRRGAPPACDHASHVLGKEPHVLHRSTDRRPRRARPGPDPGRHQQLRRGARHSADRRQRRRRTARSCAWTRACTATSTTDRRPSAASSPRSTRPPCAAPSSASPA